MRPPRTPPYSRAALDHLDVLEALPDSTYHQPHGPSWRKRYTGKQNLEHRKPVTIQVDGRRGAWEDDIRLQRRLMVRYVNGWLGQTCPAPRFQPTALNLRANAQGFVGSASDVDPQRQQQILGLRRTHLDKKKSIEFWDSLFPGLRRQHKKITRGNTGGYTHHPLEVNVLHIRFS